MGRLYLGRDPEMDRLVAIKVLREGYDSKELRERFSREAKSASTLRHANIVTIFDAGTHEGLPFIVMEYIQGETLGDLVRARALLSLDRKLQLMDELCAGLYYAHRKHVIHRDIKPANIMIDDEGVLRILDFGIARLGTGGLTQTGAVMGTLNYMAPEQLAGKRVDGRADIFSAGAVFYELLSYRRAFPGEVPAILRKIFSEDPEPLGELCPDLDSGIVAIVDRCLKKDPTNRYPDFWAVRDALAVVRRRLAATGADTMVVAPSLRDRAELRRIRAEQIQKYVDTAHNAMETASYARALHACQQALLLDPDNEQALDVGERARVALEHGQLLQQWLTDAGEALDRGALTAASLLVDRALSLNPESGDALAVRRAVDAARRWTAENAERARVVEQALARARSEAEAESFDAALAAIAEALALDDANAEAQELNAQIVAAQEKRNELREIERRNAEGERQRQEEAERQRRHELEKQRQQEAERQRLEQLERHRREKAEQRHLEDEQRRLAYADLSLRAGAALRDQAPDAGPDDLTMLMDRPLPRAVADESRPIGAGPADRRQRSFALAESLRQPAVLTLAVVLAVGAALAMWRWTPSGGPSIEPVSTAPTVKVPASSSAPTATPTPPPAAPVPSAQSPPNGPTEAVGGASRMTALRAATRDAWRRGDRQSALESLGVALNVQPVDPETLALAADFVEEARDFSAATAATARAVGANGGAYEAAQAREREAAFLAQTGQSVRAVRSYLEAAELFAKASGEAQRAAAKPAPGTPAVSPRQGPPPPPRARVGAARVPAETPAANLPTPPLPEAGPTSKPEAPPAQSVPPPPAGAPGANEGQWIIRVDANCAGMVTSVDLYIDNIPVGTATPGRGVVKRVPTGTHSVSGRSPSNGYSWGPMTYNLTQSVLTTNFACD